MGGGTSGAHASGGERLAGIASRCLLWLATSNAAACEGEAFFCRAADECTQRGEAGMCLGGSCAYPDDACASGWRYAMGTGNALAGHCVEATGTAMEVGTGSTGTPPPPPGNGSSRGSTTGDDAGSDETTGADASTSAVPGTDDFESTGACDPTDAASTTEPAAICDALDCASCFACAIEPGQACADLDDDCEDATDCDASAICMWSCAIKGLCFDDCCSGLADASASTAHDLHTCRAEACAAACPDLPQPYCSA